MDKQNIHSLCFLSSYHFCIVVTGVQNHIGNLLHLVRKKKKGQLVVRTNQKQHSCPTESQGWKTRRQQKNPYI